MSPTARHHAQAMTNKTLAQSYGMKAEKRLKILPVLLREEAYSDLVREAQEIVELPMKGVLRQIGIEPPKWQDVGSTLAEFQDRPHSRVRSDVARLAEISAWLRKEREFSFYGDIDFIPTEEYDLEVALKAIADARFVCDAASATIPSRAGQA